jgi:hypothetical protein
VLRCLSSNVVPSATSRGIGARDLNKHIRIIALAPAESLSIVARQVINTGSGYSVHPGVRASSSARFHVSRRAADDRQTGIRDFLVQRVTRIASARIREVENGPRLVLSLWRETEFLAIERSRKNSSRMARTAILDEGNRTQI